MKPFKGRFGLGVKEVWITSDWHQYANWVATKIGAVEKEPTPELLGRCYGSFIWLRTPGDAPVAVHEIVHAVDFWMEAIGISNDTEVRAYTVEGILREYMKHIGRNL